MLHKKIRHGGRKGKDKKQHSFLESTDDFVVDDDGRGYVDYGQDEDNNDYDSDEEDDKRFLSKKAKGKESTTHHRQKVDS